MNVIGEYLDELGAALEVRGSARRRFVRECRDHLTIAAASVGEDEAVRAFGPAAEIAAAFDVEAAAGRAMRSTFATVAGVVATAGSTLVLIDAASPHASAQVWAAITFFVSAQVAGVALALAVLQMLVMRRSQTSAADVALLARRDGCALLAAATTILAAGAAVPGRGPAVAIGVGPVLVCVAMLAVLRTRSFARRLDGARTVVVRPPFEELARLVRVPLPSIDNRLLLLVTALIAQAAAFARDLGEQSTANAALVSSGIEAAAVVGCFVLLGPVLGLWHDERVVGIRRRSR